MGVPEANTSLIYGIHLRESANDGSDFTNAAADYRVVFLGEDGELHKKDSAGSVTSFAGTGIPATILDAKGDLISATAADTAARLAVGTNGKVLVAASGESTGLKWDRPGFVGARVYHNANQSLTAGVDTALAFNQERYDTDTFHDTSSNNTRLTPPVTGYYHITGTCSFTADATAWSGLWIRVAGSTKIAQIRGRIEDGSNVMSLTVSTDYLLTATTDYVELMAFSSAGTRNALVLANYSPEFTISLLGV